MEFGKHPQLTYVEGSTSVPISAVNLNESERVLEMADNELAFGSKFQLSKFIDYYYQKNCNEIEDFNNDSLYTALASTTIEADYNRMYINYQTTRFIENDNTGSVIGMYRVITSKDLTVFNDGGVSSTDDCIEFTFFISDKEKFNDLTLKLGTDDSNCYYYSENPSNWSGDFDYDGYHTWSLPKKDFSSVGTPPSWGAITFIRIQATTNANAINEYITCLHLGLFRVDPDDATNFNPMQSYKGAITGWTNDLTPIGFGVELVQDKARGNVIGLIPMAQDNFSWNQQALKAYGPMICGTMKLELYAKWYNYGASAVWWHNSSNFIEVAIRNGSFVFHAIEAGVLTEIIEPLDDVLNYNERYELELTKIYGMIKATVFKDNSQVKTIDYEATFSNDLSGDFYIGWYSSFGCGLITDIIISNDDMTHLNTWDIPKIVIKINDESKASTTTYAPDDELQMKLPPNTMFEVECFLAVDGTDTGQDIKITWGTSGDVEDLTKRFGFGPGRNATDIYDATMYAQGRGLQSDSEYGVVSAGWSYIHERCILKTGINGAKVTIDWAQRVNSATAIIVKGGSYMKATRVKY